MCMYIYIYIHIYIYRERERKIIIYIYIASRSAERSPSSASAKEVTTSRAAMKARDVIEAQTGYVVYTSRLPTCPFDEKGKDIKR